MSKSDDIPQLSPHFNLYLHEEHLLQIKYFKFERNTKQKASWYIKTENKIQSYIPCKYYAFYNSQESLFAKIKTKLTQQTCFLTASMKLRFVKCCSLIDSSAKDFKLATESGRESCIQKQISTTQLQSQITVNYITNRCEI